MKKLDTGHSILLAALALICCWPLQANGQLKEVYDAQEWHYGKVILATGDSLFGSVVYYPVQDVVQVALNDGAISSFSPVNVSHFIVRDKYSGKPQVFRSFFWNQGNANSDFKKPVFFEQLNDGTISLIKRQIGMRYSGNGNGYYVDANNPMWYDTTAEVVLSKFYVILALAAFSTVFLLVLGLIFGLLYSTDTSVSAVIGQIDHLSYFFVQAVGYMALAMFFAFLIRKSGLAIIAFLAWSKIVEPLIHYQLDDRIDKYLPMKVFGSLTPTPGQELIDQFTAPTELLSPAWAVIPALLYIGVLLLLSYLQLRFRDL